MTFDSSKQPTYIKNLLLGFILSAFFTSNAFACFCDESRHAPEPFPEAYNKAAVIFEGVVVKMEALFCKKNSITKDLGNGLKLDISGACAGKREFKEIDPKKNNEIVSYRATVEVSKIWKDTDHEIKANEFTVQTMKAKWCGFLFEKGESYLFYGRKGDTKTELPSVSLCSRTKPLIYSFDDLDWLKKRTKGE